MKTIRKFALWFGIATVVALATSGLYLFNTYQAKREKIARPGQREPGPNLTSQPSTPTLWKTLASNSRGIVLRYPPTWFALQDWAVSQVPFRPGEMERARVYNAVSVQKYSQSMYAGVTNQETFRRIDSLESNQPLLLTEREQITKITSGTITTGEPYVIFQVDPSPKLVGDTVHQIKGFILAGRTIYQLTLDQYDETGLNVFQKIVSDARVNMHNTSD